MNIPEFNAEASLYRTNGHYRASVSECSALQLSQPILPAYIPSQETMRKCYKCLEKDCSKHLGICQAVADIACFVYPPACLSAHVGCWNEYLACLGSCHLPGELGECCPKPCRVPNPFKPGVGCCDEGEHCVDESDPNSRSGCCPRGRSVCGGKCCLPGDNCCGDQCCPANYFCLDGFCSEFPGPLLPPKGEGPPTPPPYTDYCLWGWTPCKGKCCAPGLECCPDGECKWTCIH